MILTLAWKEYREHRAIWLTMVLMTSLLGLGLGQLAGSPDFPASTFGITILAMAATYGIVCGAMMLAGEREGGTLVLLDIFLGRRGRLWFMKLLIGAALAVAEALAVALLLHFFQQPPPEWLGLLTGRESPHVLQMRGVTPPATWYLWFAVLPAVTLEAYAWGLLGSALTQRVLTGAALAVVMGVPAWLLVAFAPSPASIMLRLIIALIVLLSSAVLFRLAAQDGPLTPPPRPIDPRARVLRELERELYEEELYGRRRAPEPAWEEPVLVVPVDEPPAYAAMLEAPAAPAPPARATKRSGPRPPEAKTPGEVLLWLTLRQAWLPFIFLGAIGILVGLFVPHFGQVLWPLATLLIGIGCGTATFAWEQADLSYQFLAAQHFPLKTIWNVKMIFWGAAALLSTFLLASTAALIILFLFTLPPGAEGRLVRAPFDFGGLQHLLGPVLFFGVWLVYGFCVGQVFVLFCRKAVYAVILSAMVSLAALGLWLSSLLCRGMSGWQVWAPPLVMLAGTRCLVRAWAGGRIKERMPLLALAGFTAAALAWVALNLGHRAWEVPDAGEPLDRAAFRDSIPTGQANAAAQKIQESLAELEKAGGKEGPWLARIAESTALPPGVIEMPSAEGQAPTLRHLPSCQAMTGKLRTLAKLKRGAGQAGPAFDHLAQILALSRTLRNKAPVVSYLAGIEAEKSALDGLDAWFAHGKPSVKVMLKVTEELTRHERETPGPRDCLETECFRAGGVLQNPVAWAFYSGGAPGPRLERPLAGGIALFLDTPWESERKTRLWRAGWAGAFRAIDLPPDQATPTEQVSSDNETTRRILRGWQPAAASPDASLNRDRLARLLDASWLADDRLFVSAAPLRAAALRARWRVEAARQAAALALHQLREGKVAEKLRDVDPGAFWKPAVDPYQGEPLHYRVSQGEELTVHGPQGVTRIVVRPGQAVLWSTGPDRKDDGGVQHGAFAEDDPRWLQGGFDLVTVVPFWRP